MLNIYPAIFHKEDNAYWVEFPDLEGCQTSGSTLEETVALASEALGLYIASLTDRGVSAPKPSQIGDIKTHGDSFVSYIYCNPTQYQNKTKAVKKTLTIPQWLNEEAERQHVNFSSVLQEALKERLGMQ